MMNNRIKQISQEVWEWSDSQEYKGVDEFSEIWEAEFARRIIQECAEVVKESQWTEAKGEYYEGFNEGLNYGAVKIQKHFGVK
jgi:hypothetical protein